MVANIKALLLILNKKPCFSYKVWANFHSYHSRDNTQKLFAGQLRQSSIGEELFDVISGLRLLPKTLLQSRGGFPRLLFLKIPRQYAF